MSENKIDKGRIQAATSRNNKSRLLGTGIIASMMILSIVVLSTMQGQLSSKVAYAQATPFSDTFKKVTKNFQTFPQPNANNTLITANASKALFEPAAGLSNVFGPAGLFPFKDTFNCANALTCGVSAGNNSKFIGIFDQGNKHNMTGYEATYTSPVTYGPEQIKGHTYKITLTDTQWNSPDAAKPTRQAEFAQMVNNVGFNQIQHGASHVDRSDVPQLFDNAFLYGHAKVTDTTNGNNTVVAKDIFTHVMVAHVMNENTYYRSLKDSAQSPTLVFLFAINIPSDVALP